MAAFSASLSLESEHAHANGSDDPDSVHRACAETKLFNQEGLRVVLSDTKLRLISLFDVTKGTLNDAPAYPKEILYLVITQAAHSFVPAHNHPSADFTPWTEYALFTAVV